MLYTTQQLQGEGSLVSSPEHLAGVALVQPPRNRKGVNFVYRMSHDYYYFRTRSDVNIVHPVNSKPVKTGTMDSLTQRWRQQGLDGDHSRTYLFNG